MKNNNTLGNLYIDLEGVQRGYYVYLHKDVSTEQVFYVGMGHGKRAWQSHIRNALWNKYVSNLVQGWKVEIVENNLNELEAQELEKQLIEKYGGAKSMGGNLTNRFPGGDLGIQVNLDDDVINNKSFETHQKVLKFKEYPRNKQEEIVKTFFDKLSKLADIFETIEEKADAKGNIKLENDASDVGSIVISLCEICENFLKRRISWKSFGSELMEELENFEFVIDDLFEYHPSVRKISKAAYDISLEYFEDIVSES